MNIQYLSVGLPFLGSFLIAISQQFGFGTVWGGNINFKSKVWGFINLVGWLMLIFGFGLQLVDCCEK